MKKTTLFILVAVFAATGISSGCFSKRLHAENAKQVESNGNDDADFKAREEITQTYTLASNAKVDD